MRAFSLLAIATLAIAQPHPFRAGAAAVDITPERFPVIVNGMFLSRTAEKAYDKIHSRAIILDDGSVRIAIVVVDSCMVPRDLLDQAKELARQRSGIPTDRMLISATHTHSAPAAMGCLGTDADPTYGQFLVPKIAESIERANSRLEPARIGWGSVDDFDHTHCRRWILRPDKMRDDPFGKRTVRANMHPGYQNPDAICPSGPVDPQLSLVSVQSIDGRPLALLANYSMHYFGSPLVSSDYFGLFAEKIARSAGAADSFVAMMSQGTSGDQMWMDYGKPKSGISLDEYSRQVADAAFEAYRKIEHRAEATIAMAETTLSLRRRVPDAERLDWARKLVASFKDGMPRTQPEVYAREQMMLDADPVRELKLQALRIGDIAVTSIPNEVFAITGMKLKARSPFARTFNIELANGAEGYIPPPEQHELGGYTTWPARTAGLEADAEPRIVETLLGLLERVAGQPRRSLSEPNGAYARAVIASRPEAYWRLGEIDGKAPADAMGRHAAKIEGHVALFLPGPQSNGFSSTAINRSVYLAGGRIVGSLAGLGENYTVEFWLWNGAPGDAALLERGAERLVLDGAGKLRLGDSTGMSEIAPKTWRHVVLVRKGRSAQVFLDGKRELRTKLGAAPSGDTVMASVEGKIDELAVYRRALSASEVARHYREAGAVTDMQ